MFGVDLTIGPTIDEGFYYDCYMGDGRGTLTQARCAPFVAPLADKAEPPNPRLFAVTLAVPSWRGADAITPTPAS